MNYASRPKTPESNAGVCELSKRSRQREHRDWLECLDTNKGYQCLMSEPGKTMGIKRDALCEAFCEKSRRAKPDERLNFYMVSENRSAMADEPKGEEVVK
jgi:hypothetical protein